MLIGRELGCFESFRGVLCVFLVFWEEERYGEERRLSLFWRICFIVSFVVFKGVVRDRFLG
jgi:hypothetical protein